MKNLFLKVKIIFVPFLLVAVGTILFYAGFRWLFDFQWHILSLKKEIWEFWIGFGLPIVTVFLFLRKRIKILEQSTSGNRHFMYLIFMVIAIGTPNLLLQEYLSKAIFDLKKLDSVVEVKNFEHEKYFKIKSFSVAREKAAIHTITNKTGRYKSDIDFKYYAAAPFGTLESKVWHGTKYSERHDNRTEEKNKQAYKIFMEHSTNKFSRCQFQKANYFEKLTASNDRDAYLTGITYKYPKTIADEQIILIPKTGNFEDRLGDDVFWGFVVFGISITAIFTILLFPSVDKTAYKKRKNTSRKYQ